MQLNCYALMLREHSFDVTGLEIVAICRDWRKNDAKRYAHEGYPAFQVAVIPITLWPSRVTREFMEERVRLHQAARESLPFCTDEERWMKPASWALMKTGRKSAVKLYSSEAEASRAKDADPGLYIEHRPGVAVRCNDYCAVSSMCRARLDGQFGDAEPQQEVA